MSKDWNNPREMYIEVAYGRQSTCLELNSFQGSDWDSVISWLREESHFNFKDSDYDNNFEKLKLINCDFDGVEVKNTGQYSPQELFETIMDSGVLDDDELYTKMEAVAQAVGFDEFMDLVDEHSEEADGDWDDYVSVYNKHKYSIEEVAQDIYSIWDPSYKQHSISEFIDWTKYSKVLFRTDNLYDTEYGYVYIVM